MRRLVPALAGIWLFAVAARADQAPIIAGVDRIVVYKRARSLVLFSQGQPVYTISGIQLGPAPVGPKHFQGDGRTPEGHYRVDYGNENSGYHFALHISYPSPDDAAYAHERQRQAGGDIFIHGQPNDWSGRSRVPGDWTAGCIALTDREIETLWQSVPDGTPIAIAP
jgi:murein L,D-transpeptidase YafK